MTDFDAGILSLVLAWVSVMVLMLTLNLNIVLGYNVASQCQHGRNRGGIGVT